MRQIFTRKSYWVLFFLVCCSMGLTMVIERNQSRAEGELLEAEGELLEAEERVMMLSEALAATADEGLTSLSDWKTFKVPLPSAEWEPFEDLEGCFWRRKEAAQGRAIEFRTPADFVFGVHYHDYSERVTLVDGLVLFGAPRLRAMKFLRPGESGWVEPNTPHFLRALEDAVFRVDWAELESDTLTITTR